MPATSFITWRLTLKGMVTSMVRSAGLIFTSLVCESGSAFVGRDERGGDDAMAGYVAGYAAYACRRPPNMRRICRICDLSESP